MILIGYFMNTIKALPTLDLQYEYRYDPQVGNCQLPTVKELS